MNLMKMMKGALGKVKKTPGSVLGSSGVMNSSGPRPVANAATIVAPTPAARVKKRKGLLNKARGILR